MRVDLLDRVSQAWRHLACDDRGNIAVIFAIMALPMLSFVGVAVDFSRASSARSAMQAALDSTSLMIAKEAATSSDLNARAAAVFAALYKHDEVTGVTIATAYTAQSGTTPGKLVITGAGQLPTTFMKVVGFNKMDIGTSSTTTWASMKLRVALALDNTGSMDKSKKLVELKKAAKILVARLRETVVANGDVYISLVPFHWVVNIGNSATTSPYLDWSWWDRAGSETQGKSHASWTGCVKDRAEPDDISAAASGNFPPELYITSNGKKNVDACTTLQPLLPLTYDFDAINTGIDSMVALGGTNQPVGLFWAWWTLRSAAPFAAPPKDPNSQYLTAIVLLTDGENTGNSYYDDKNKGKKCNGTSLCSEVDTRQQYLCDAIKADNGTLIYTVDVNTDNGPSRPVLKTCASGESKFFALTNAEQMTGAFEEIAASMRKLRVAQ
ncbi:pilus assembly protein [Rhodopseudomonas sp. HC1]|uniref:TadE/TadG family type IV pilus assembly protein n=1 Tax=Rhodopseudomonas infernalis TaxID=2897386 RepID=UPI001EE99240|nr:TadE/TadG family type IV pilus assembly protein [Rhodopseudomonas infernalis]MCG6203053.1 pilus assembly protein [Rhodopseudomonas infernalis]